MDKKKNVFISHYGKDNPKIDDLKSLLKGKGYELRDSSVSSKDNKANNPEYVKQQILKPKIDWAGQLIVLIGEKTHSREFVNWEIEQANKQGMSITGVYLHKGKTEDYPLPENFEKNGTSLTGWNGETVIKALEGDYNNFQSPNGEDRSPYWSGGRSEC